MNKIINAVTGKTFSALVSKTLVSSTEGVLPKALSAKGLQVFLLRSITKPKGRKGVK